MEYLFDTVNISDIRKYMDIYPITGITSNPSIIFQHEKLIFSLTFVKSVI
jgi:transaldolase